MINPFIEVNWNPGLEEKRKFAASLIIGFPCVAVVLLLVRRIFAGTWHWEPSLWVGGAGLGLGLVLLALPILARPFYFLWYFLACCIGIVISNLLFVSFFFLVLTPLGLLLRALGRISVQKSFSKKAKTYWHEVDRVDDVKQYYRQF